MSAPAARAAATMDPQPQRLSTTRSRRLVIYNLLAGQHLFNYLCRLAIPFIVPFICSEYGFTAAERGMLLNSFTPGYVLTQIPASYMIQKIGAKAVLSLNNLGVMTAMILLPVAAKTGATAVAACFALLGIVQGPCAQAA